MKGIFMNDWRLRGQEKYLSGVDLYWRKYKPTRADWDHDHCAFCRRKFAVQNGDFDEGYTTEDEYHWICRDCFQDFKDKFGWKVK